MDLIAFFNAERQKAVDELRLIADAADTEGRGLKEEERTRVKELQGTLAEFQTKISSEIEKKAVTDMANGFDRTQDPNPVPASARATAGPARSLGEALVSSEWFKGLQAKVKNGGSVPEFKSPSFEVSYRTKTAGDEVAELDNTELFGSGGNAGALTTMFPLETPGFVQRRLMIADLLPSVPITTGNSASWPIVDTRGVLDYTPQTELQDKPAGEYKFDVTSAQLTTLAGWVKVSNQFLEDAPGLVAYINADLPFQVRFNEENYLAYELYQAADSATAITGGSSMFDSILDAKTTIQLNNFEPNGLVIYPSDWAILLAEKFTNAGYVGGGPFTATNNPWGLNVVVTQAATEGSPLVGDFNRGAKVFRRGGMSVRTTNSDGTDFVKNITTILAELRLVIGVQYPEAFAEASVTS